MNDWIIEDALFLRQNNKLKSCLILLACQIDHLAKNQFPEKKSNKDRYVSFLDEKLAPLFLDRMKLRMSDGITVPQKKYREENDVEKISAILYHEIRNYLIHDTDAREKYTSNLVVNYNSGTSYDFNPNPKKGFLSGWSTDFGDPTGKWVVDANWIIDLFIWIIKSS